jgi:hypothetical protein
MKMNDITENILDALCHSLVLEIDGDFLSDCGTVGIAVDMKSYVVECRKTLKEKYGFVPFPFEDDNYWS